MEIPQIHIILFYKFVNIEKPGKFQKEHQTLCNNLGIKGKVLVAYEGINGSVSGTKSQIDEYKKHLILDSRFRDIEFKEEVGYQHPFEKMIVKVKKEIIKIEQDLDMNKVGEHISPQEFLNICENNGDIVILDTRNDYESRVGKFKNAITPNIQTFKEFPNYIKKSKLPKNKSIVMYCTGGIRCEKASAYMIKEGFTNVKQLHGGIINFCQKLPNTLWEGSCFVFDNRLTSNINQESKPITHCNSCKSPCDLYRNCKNERCNKLIFICGECKQKNHSCCSQECLKKILKN
jgi:UPF0176 protein